MAYNLRLDMESAMALGSFDRFEVEIDPGNGVSLANENGRDGS